MRRRRLTQALLWSLLLLLNVLPLQAVLACAIDGKASVSADGVEAILNTSRPAAHQIWAPFTFDQSFAAGSPIHLDESRTELLLSLDSATVAGPYRWAFGDSKSVEGHAVAHAYAHPGTYEVVVDGYNSQERHWFTFDRVLVHVVKADQAAAANIGFTLNRIGDAVMSSLVWIADAAIVLLIAATILYRRRRSTRTPST